MTPGQGHYRPYYIISDRSDPEDTEWELTLAINTPKYIDKYSEGNNSAYILNSCIVVNSAFITISAYENI